MHLRRVPRTADMPRFRLMQVSGHRLWAASLKTMVSHLYQVRLGAELMV